MAGHAFPRAARLLRPAEFQQVFAAPERHHAAGLVLLARANDTGHCRLGLAIAKKHARAAVDRNRIKRQTREAFRLAASELPAVDLIVLGKPGVDRFSNADLRQQLQQLLARLRKRRSVPSSPDEPRD